MTPSFGTSGGADRALPKDRVRQVWIVAVNSLRHFSKSNELILQFDKIHCVLKN